MKGVLPQQHLVTMRALVSMVPTPQSYYFTTLLPTEKWESDEVMWEVEYNTGGMTPFVAPGTPSPSIGMDSLGAKNAKVAFWKERSYMDEQLFNNLRAPGTFATKQTAARTLARQTAKLTRRCQARQEWMACKSMTTGFLVYQNTQGVKFTVDYGIPAANKIVLSSDYFWGTGSKRDPMQDMFNLKVAMANNFGVAPNVCVMNSITLSKLLYDATFSSNFEKSKFGDGDLYSHPAEVIGTMLGVGPIRLIDGMYELHLRPISNVYGGTEISTLAVEDASDVEVGGTIRFFSGLRDNTWEDFTVSAVNKDTNVLTLSPLGTLSGTITPVSTYMVGRDSVVMKKKYIPDNLVVIMCDTVDGMPIGNFALSPHGMDGAYGMTFHDWMSDDPEGLSIRVENKGLPMIYHPESIGTIQVAANLIS